MSDLAERVAVITGGGGGIGRADALKLAAAGASIVLGDLDLARAEATAAAVRAAGGEAPAVRVDVADEADVEAFLERAAAPRGRVDVLDQQRRHLQQHARGGDGPGRLVADADHPPDRDVSLRAGGAALHGAARRGAIVNMSSGLGYRGGAGVTHYATAKAGPSASPAPWRWRSAATASALTPSPRGSWRRRCRATC